MGRLKTLKVEGVSINDLAVAYSTGKEIGCNDAHRDGYEQSLCGLKVFGLKRTKESGKHIVHAEINADVNRPGEDAGDNCIWQKIKFRFNEYLQIGKVYR